MRVHSPVQGEVICPPMRCRYVINLNYDTRNPFLKGDKDFGLCGSFKKKKKKKLEGGHAFPSSKCTTLKC